LLCLFSIRTPVVMPVEDILAGVESVFDDSAGNVLASVVGHAAATEIVG
jgi:hypothetical protein